MFILQSVLRTTHVSSSH